MFTYLYQLRAEAQYYLLYKVQWRVLPPIPSKKSFKKQDDVVYEQNMHDFLESK